MCAVSGSGFEEMSTHLLRVVAWGGNGRKRGRLVRITPDEWDARITDSRGQTRFTVEMGITYTGSVGMFDVAWISSEGETFLRDSSIAWPPHVGWLHVRMLLTDSGCDRAHRDKVRAAWENLYAKATAYEASEEFQEQVRQRLAAAFA